MIIKRGIHGASIAGIKPEAVVGMIVAQSVMSALSAPFRLSSGLEGKHNRNSLHFAGLAFDISARDIDADKYDGITHLLTESLGDEFDVIFETNHWHIEFQPERRLP